MLCLIGLFFPGSPVSADAPKLMLATVWNPDDDRLTVSYGPGVAASR